ncbi:MAG: hypothetical protein HY905_06280 [Deltaproteobacteria bacterium]|nr:hypothetical protein [Deltaproteobacteria bacterium]
MAGTDRKPAVFGGPRDGGRGRWGPWFIAACLASWLISAGARAADAADPCVPPEVEAQLDDCATLLPPPPPPVSPLTVAEWCAAGAGVDGPVVARKRAPPAPTIVSEWQRRLGCADDPDSADGQALDTLLVETSRALEDRPEADPADPDVYFQLAELQLAAAREQACAALDLDARCRHDDPGPDGEQDPRCERRSAVRQEASDLVDHAVESSYRLTQDFPESKRMDEALFGLAVALEWQARLAMDEALGAQARRNSRTALSELVSREEPSSLADFARVALADSACLEDPQWAMEQYDAPPPTGGATVPAEMLYSKAWCLARQGNLEDAVDAFHELHRVIREQPDRPRAAELAVAATVDAAALLLAELDEWRAAACLPDADAEASARSAARIASLLADTAMRRQADLPAEGERWRFGGPETDAVLKMFDAFLASFGEPASPWFFDRLERPDGRESPAPTVLELRLARAGLLERSEQWHECGEAFDGVFDVDPSGPLAQQALLGAALCYQGDRERFLARLEEPGCRGRPALAGGPRSRLRHDCEYLTGVAWVPGELGFVDENVERALHRYTCFADPPDRTAEFALARARVYDEGDRIPEAAALYARVAEEYDQSDDPDERRIAVEAQGARLATLVELAWFAVRVPDSRPGRRYSTDSHDAPADARTPMGCIQDLRDLAPTLRSEGFPDADAVTAPSADPDWAAWAAELPAVAQFGGCLADVARLRHALDVSSAAELAGLVADLASGGSCRAELLQATWSATGGSCVAADTAFALAETIAEIGFPDGAAARYEQAARTWIGAEQWEERIVPSLVRAIDIHLALGNTEQALLDIALLDENQDEYPRYSTAVAVAWFEFGDGLAANRAWEALTEHDTVFLERYAEGAGKDRELRAMVRLARAWRERSLCDPDEDRLEVLRACRNAREQAAEWASKAVELAGLPFPPATLQVAGDVPAPEREQTRTALDLALGIDADVHRGVYVETVLRPAVPTAAAVGPDALATQRTSLAAEALAEARFLLGELLFEEFIAETVPAFLPQDWHPDPDDVTRCVQAGGFSGSECLALKRYELWTRERFVPFLKDHLVKLADTRRQWAAIAWLDAPDWAVAAAARVGEAYLYLWRQILDVPPSPIPSDMVDELSRDLAGTVADVVEPIRNDAIDAFVRCRELAAREQAGGFLAAFCSRQLENLDPERFVDLHEAYAGMVPPPTHHAVPDLDLGPLEVDGGGPTSGQPTPHQSSR